VFQPQLAVGAPRRPSGSGFGVMVVTLGCGIIFGLPLILVQAIVPHFFQIDDVLASRNALLLLTFTTIEILCSFLAALLVARHTGTLGPGV